MRLAMRSAAVKLAFTALKQIHKFLLLLVFSSPAIHHPRASLAESVSASCTLASSRSWNPHVLANYLMLFSAPSARALFAALLSS